MSSLTTAWKVPFLNNSVSSCLQYDPNLIPFLIFWLIFVIPFPWSSFSCVSARAAVRSSSFCEAPASHGYICAGVITLVGETQGFTWVERKIVLPLWVSMKEVSLSQLGKKCGPSQRFDFIRYISTLLPSGSFRRLVTSSAQFGHWFFSRPKDSLPFASSLSISWIATSIVRTRCSWVRNGFERARRGIGPYTRRMGQRTSVPIVLRTENTAMF